MPVNFLDSWGGNFAVFEPFAELLHADRALFPLRGPLTVGSRVMWVLIAWGVACGVLLLIGRGRSLAQGASLARRVRAAAWLATMTTLPVLIWMLLYQPARSDQFDILIPIAAWTLALLYSHMLMRPPVWISSGDQQLPVLESGPFVERVRALARRMEVELTAVRLIPTVGGEQHVLAWIGTLPAPQLVVTDGILNRLTGDEADAIVAHELGHLANHTLWIYPLTMSIAVTVGTAHDAWSRWHVCLLLTAAVYSGLSRIVSRWLEYDCDARAARVMGAAVYASALTKLNAVHSLNVLGPWRRWVEATSTHPSIEHRLAAIERMKPPVDQVRAEPGPTATGDSPGGILIWVALTVWILVVGVGGVVAHRTGLWWWWEGALLVVALAPTVLARLAQRRATRLVQQRVEREWIRFLPVALLLVVMFDAIGFRVLVSLPTENRTVWAQLLRVAVPAGWLLLAVLCAVVIGIALWKRPQRRLRNATTAAMLVHNFDRVVELAEAQPHLVARDPIVRNNVALCRAVLGDVARACTDLERLAEDRPGFLMPLLTAADLRLHLDQPERTLELADRAARLSPQDAVPWILRVRALRRLGRLDEAHAAWETLAGLAPQFGTTLALGALIASDRGELEELDEQVQQAIAASPGDPFPLLVAAELAFRAGDIDEAEASFQQAADAAPRNRFQFIGPELEHVRQLLAAGQPPNTGTPGE